MTDTVSTHTDLDVALEAAEDAAREDISSWFGVVDTPDAFVVRRWAYVDRPEASDVASLQIVAWFTHWPY